MLFRKLEGEQAVLRSEGLYRQVDVYLRGNNLFAKWGAGYISLYEGYTSRPKVMLEYITCRYALGHMGRLERRDDLAPARKFNIAA